jgi:hypothetical protein
MSKPESKIVGVDNTALTSTLHTIADRFPILRSEARELVGNLEESQEEGEWSNEDQEVDTENAITAMQEISGLSDVPESIGKLTYDFRLECWDNALDNAKEIADELRAIYQVLPESDDEWTKEVEQAVGFCSEL